jgi:hypothetical protein
MIRPGTRCTGLFWDRSCLEISAARCLFTGSCLCYCQLVQLCADRPLHLAIVADFGLPMNVNDPAMDSSRGSSFRPLLLACGALPSSRDLLASWQRGPSTPLAVPPSAETYRSAGVLPRLHDESLLLSVLAALSVSLSTQRRVCRLRGRKTSLSLEPCTWLILECIAGDGNACVEGNAPLPAPAPISRARSGRNTTVF